VTKRGTIVGIFLLLATLLVPLGLFAAEKPAWLPKPARGAGDTCVADVEWMRRNHMTMLNHERDRTVHDGARKEAFGLSGCVSCHAVKGADGKPVSASHAGHFCRTCHDYAAVKIDCFECHASRPAAGPGPRRAASQ